MRRTILEGERIASSPAAGLRRWAARAITCSPEASMKSSAARSNTTNRCPWSITAHRVHEGAQIGSGEEVHLAADAEHGAVPVERDTDLEP